MPLSPETKERIKHEAEKKFPKNEKAAKEFTTRVWAEQQGYIAGAEAWAERAAGLVDLLAKIRDHLPPKTMFVKEITEAINKYNSPSK